MNTAAAAYHGALSREPRAAHLVVARRTVREISAQEEPLGQRRANGETVGRRNGKSSSLSRTSIIS